MKDPIVDEVRAVREAVACEYGYDVKKLVATLREQQEKSGRKVARQPSRKVRPEKKLS